MCARKIDDIQIENAYREICNGESLRGMADKITYIKNGVVYKGIDKKTLGEYIKSWISEQGERSEKYLEAYEKAMGRNKGDGSARASRGKKNHAMDSEPYKNAIEYLNERKIGKDFRDKILDKTRNQDKKQDGNQHEKRGNSHQTIAIDTLPIKIKETIEFFESLNDGIDVKSDVYFSINDIKDIILDFPGILSITTITLQEKYNAMLGEIHDEERLKKIIKVYPVDFNYGPANMLIRVKKHSEYLRMVDNTLEKFKDFKRAKKQRG